MNFFVFIILFLYIANLFQINKFISEIGKSKGFGKRIEDKYLIDLVKKKTGLKLDYIAIFNSDKPFGMMPGLPAKPHMILSKKLYETFNKDELDWVVLHESTHCIMYHTLKFALIEFALIINGLFLLSIFNNFYSAVFLSLLSSLLFVQVARFFEREADNFAINKVDNPKGVITATEKLTNAYPSTLPFDFRRKFLSWNILPSERIAIASKEIQNRK